MAKAFTLVSWNIEHFKNQGSRVTDVVALLASLNPDIFALYEVEGKDVFGELVKQMPGYQFHITEGPQVQEILVGVRGGITAFFTQKIEFKSGNQSLRPGALLTATIGQANYSLLFLHTKSGATPIGWGIRDDMLERALDFSATLAAASPDGSVNYLFMGDLNTMGLEYLLKVHNIPATAELEKLDQAAKKRGMVRLKKDEPATWWNGSESRMKPADLDQVVATTRVKFRDFSGAQVKVLGWAKLATPATKTEWIKRYSDHSPLFLEVLKS